MPPAGARRSAAGHCSRRLCAVKTENAGLLFKRNYPFRAGLYNGTAIGAKPHLSKTLPTPCRESKFALFCLLTTQGIHSILSTNMRQAPDANNPKEKDKDG